MPLLTWNDNYSVKIIHLDDQHLKLVSMINELHEAIVQGESKDVLDRVLQYLRRYVVSHFSEEEYYMQKFNYTEYEYHKSKHDGFISKVDAFLQEYETGSQELSVKVTQFLVQWLHEHITIEDQKYSACFIENGLR